jgi:hypothetical protein
MKTYALFFKPVNDEVSEERANKLQCIVETASDLASKLATQNPEIKVLLLNGFKGQPFAIGDSRFKPHRALRLNEGDNDSEDIDPEETGWMGREIDLVISPTIIRAGKGEGKDYDQETVLVKAIVWMLKEPTWKTDRESNTKVAGGASAEPQDVLPTNKKRHASTGHGFVCAPNNEDNWAKRLERALNKRVKREGILSE